MPNFHKLVLNVVIENMQRVWEEGGDKANCSGSGSEVIEASTAFPIIYLAPIPPNQSASSFFIPEKVLVQL